MGDEDKAGDPPTTLRQKFGLQNQKYCDYVCEEECETTPQPFPSPPYTTEDSKHVLSTKCLYSKVKDQWLRTWRLTWSPDGISVCLEFHFIQNFLCFQNYKAKNLKLI